MKRLLIVVIAITLVICGCARNRPAQHKQAPAMNTKTSVVVKKSNVVPEYLVYVGKDGEMHTVQVLAWAAVGEQIGKDANGRPLHQMYTRWDPAGRLSSRVSAR